MLSGRAMRRHLASMGVPAQKVVRKQASGDYVADFFIPQMEQPIAPAREWAQRIRATVPQAQIKNTHDTVAEWRPGKPVIYATVTFTVQGEIER
ncbi:MAG: hypothetical protein KC496_11610 [Anaerolineae bacterium]|nr:hypothetical protein [Anaerolineae bacterium]